MNVYMYISICVSVSVKYVYNCIAGTHWTNEILLLLLHGHTSSKSKSEFMLEACKTIGTFSSFKQYINKT